MHGGQDQALAPSPSFSKNEGEGSKDRANRATHVEPNAHYLVRPPILVWPGLSTTKLSINRGRKGVDVGEKGSGVFSHAALGRPRGRNVDSIPTRLASRRTQASSPKGRVGEMAGRKGAGVPRLPRRRGAWEKRRAWEKRGRGRGRKGVGSLFSCCSRPPAGPQRRFHPSPPRQPAYPGFLAEGAASFHTQPERLQFRRAVGTIHSRHPGPWLFYGPVTEPGCQLGLPMFPSPDARPLPVFHSCDQFRP